MQYDHLLKLSHTFNIMDARGAVGVTERAKCFGTLRNLARQITGKHRPCHISSASFIELPALLWEGTIYCKIVADIVAVPHNSWSLITRQSEAVLVA